MSGWSELWHSRFLGNELGEWAIALAIFLITFTVLPLIKRAISRRRRREAPGPQGYIALDLLTVMVARTNRLFLWGVAVWLAARDLAHQSAALFHHVPDPAPDRLDQRAATVAQACVFLQRVQLDGGGGA